MRAASFQLVALRKSANGAVGRQERHECAGQKLLSAASGCRSTVRKSIAFIVRQAGQRTHRNQCRTANAAPIKSSVRTASLAAPAVRAPVRRPRPSRRHRGRGPVRSEGSPSIRSIEPGGAKRAVLRSNRAPARTPLGGAPPLLLPRSASRADPWGAPRSNPGHRRRSFERRRRKGLFWRPANPDLVIERKPNVVLPFATQLGSNARQTAPRDGCPRQILQRKQDRAEQAVLLKWP
jgi:hypothetical protein